MTEVAQMFKPANFEARYNVKVPMRDGVKLSADIYLPRRRAGRVPAILARTPYDNGDFAGLTKIVDQAIYFVQHGYAFVVQDVRGRFDSEGEFYPWVNEYDDGHDTVEWVGEQEWCDGNVGMMGFSYVGGVQWQAAMSGESHLKCIAPGVIGDDHHGQTHFQGGAMQLGLDMTWTFLTDARTWHPIDNYDWKQVLVHLPLSEMAGAAGVSSPRLADWIDHPDYDDYWKRIAYKERYEDVEIPVMQIGGWYDTFTAGTMNNFVGMLTRGGTKLARDNQKVIIGPWVHQASELTHAGDRDFGKDSVLDLNFEHLRWFDRWLKGTRNGVETEAPIKLFVMGAEAWRDEHEWPLARTRFTPFHLRSGGNANSLRGDGSLGTQPPGDEPPDEYDYDPAFPVPSNGGNNCCSPEIVPWGGYDQRQVEQREDVLVYTSRPLDEDLEVTGPVTARIYASSSAPDTDFTAKLLDVHPDGYSLNLCDGIIRGRYRDSFERQVPLEPDTVYEFTIDLFPTSNVFKAGHRIRLEVSSSNFPRFDRNLNTGGRFGYESDMRVAHQKIYHDAERPSHVLLPVIPVE